MDVDAVGVGNNDAGVRYGVVGDVSSTADFVKNAGNPVILQGIGRVGDTRTRSIVPQTWTQVIVNVIVLSGQVQNVGELRATADLGQESNKIVERYFIVVECYIVPRAGETKFAVILQEALGHCHLIA